MTKSPDTIPPNAGGSPGDIADEQLAHGLLGFLDQGTAAEQKRRVEQVMAAIDGAGLPSASARRLPWTALVMAAAAILVVFLVFVLSRGPSVSALVDAAVAAARDSGSRRYDLSVLLHPDAPSPALTAQLDIADTDHALLRVQAHGVVFTMGRNGLETWAVGPNEGARHLQHGHGWPPWLGLDHSVVLLDSVDDLLQHLRHGYELRQGEDEALDGHGGSVFERIVAQRRVPVEAHPDRVDVWLDRGSRIVQRMELRWTPAGGHEHRQHPPGAQHEAPHLIAGAPHLDDQHDSVPHLMVYRLVDRPAFAADWFELATHSK